MKSELAGKRGICPECGARFIVPSESGGRASADSSSPPSKGGVKGGTNGVPIHPNAASTLAFPESFGSAAAPPAFAPSAGNDAQWYVRTPAGEQFGPTTTATMTAWIAEGRVPDDGWAWRTGWADWRPAREVHAQLSGALNAIPSAAPVARTSSPAPPLTIASDTFDADYDWPTVEAAPPSHGELDLDFDAPATAFAPPRRRSSGPALIILGVLALVVLTAMIFVLNREPTVKTEEEASSAAAPVEADDASSSAGEASGGDGEAS